MARAQRGARRLGLAFLLAAALGAAPAHAAGRVASAIVFAVDVSGSVDDERYEVQRAGIASIFVNPGIAAMLQGGIAVMLMEWADDHVVAVPWTILREPADAAAFAARIRSAPRAPGYSTALSLALLAAADLLDACGCDAQHRVIDVSGDGPNNGPMSTKLARDEVVARGIRINGLPIVTQAEPDLARWYAANVVGGDGAFVETAQGYADFARAMQRKFLQEVAGGTRERAALAARR
jgi:hypothetical protein